MMQAHKINKKNNDSSDVSDIDENGTFSDAFNYDEKQNKQTNQDETDEYIKKVVLDRVVKYLKFDDIIKEKQTKHRIEMKKIKETKDKLEQYLIEYLDKVNEDNIQIGNKTTLIKTETQTKSQPKMEDISVCLVDGFKKYELYNTDEEIHKVVADFIKIIEDKRTIKTRKYIKRKDNNESKKKTPPLKKKQ